VTGSPADARSSAQRLDRRPGSQGGGERLPTGIAVGAATKEGEDAVAHELQHVAAMPLDGAHQPFGVAVEQPHEDRRLDAVGESGEALEVTEPEDGVDGLRLTAANLAGDDSCPRIVAEIGAHQRAPGLQAGDRLEGQRQGWHARFDQPELARCEAIGAHRRPRRDDAERLAPAGTKRVRQGEIIGAALGTKAMQQREAAGLQRHRRGECAAAAHPAR
jgi:hypothetical protein